jgi:hypothetical protein
MPTLIFVHGIANRAAAYPDTLRALRAEVERRGRHDINIVPCNWSDTYGGRLPTTIRSIPSSTGTIPDDVPARYRVWVILEVDPLAELDELQNSPPESPSFADPSTFADTLAKLRSRQDGELDNILADLGLDVVKLGQAADQLSQTTPFMWALGQYSCIASVGEPLARAVIAQAATQSAEAGFMSSTNQDRTRAATAIAQRLITTSKFLGQEILASLAASFGTRMVRKNRAHFTRCLMPVIGDVLFYQTHGEKIRALIANVIRGQKEPVTVLAHSLGGVACVDLLSLERLPEVKQLITVGSQAGLFSELGISHGDFHELKEDFPPWLNIYDRADFLSFLAEPVFGDRVPRIRDAEIESGETFPTSHSAYFTNEAAWEQILATF